ncbi:hypothetical protein [Sphingomonas montanisoli]|uniref:HK97 gp10 family phage protein n=1 Tax=Sphingomonas montanisoli TaxID=2606412 RepID=A0A5D9C429_9SPHN|nr:hypothetical protein [Sphingomonas montanisoli]TZG26504.1 hypothetical protein FYJ91_16415 [Sphingomonas montanisoli]
MPREIVKLEGFRELEVALKELPKAAGKSVLRRIARRALQLFIEAVRRLAPVGGSADEGRTPGVLRESYVIGSRLTRRQRRDAKREGKSSIELYAGTSDPAGVQQEFGNVNHRAQPHARPAWDQTKQDMLDLVGTDLGAEIEKTRTRLAKKVARIAAKNGG